MCFENYIEFHEVPIHCIRSVLTDWIWDLIRGRCLRFVHFATTGCMQRAILFSKPSNSLQKSLNSIFFLILVLLESCLQPCMTYTIAECTVNNS
jgi:hypothetical protein